MHDIVLLLRLAKGRGARRLAACNLKRTHGLVHEPIYERIGKETGPVRGQASEAGDPQGHQWASYRTNIAAGGRADERSDERTGAKTSV